MLPIIDESFYANYDKYYQALVLFVNKHVDVLRNVVLVDLTTMRRDEFRTKTSVIRYLKTMARVANFGDLALQKLELLLRKAVIATFAHPKYAARSHNDHLHFHFAPLLFRNHRVIEAPVLAAAAPTSTSSFAHSRSYLFNYMQNAASVHASIRDKLLAIQALANRHMSTQNVRIHVDVTCDNADFSKSMSDTCYNQAERKAIMLNSTFVLLMSNDPFYSWTYNLTVRLMEALKCGTVPVVLDMDIKLPLDELIAWDEIVIRLPYGRLTSLVPILLDVDETDLTNRRLRALNVYNAYFVSFTAQFRTLCAAIQERLALPPAPIPDEYVKVIIF